MYIFMCIYVQKYKYKYIYMSHGQSFLSARGVSTDYGGVMWDPYQRATRLRINPGSYIHTLAHACMQTYIFYIFIRLYLYMYKYVRIYIYMYTHKHVSICT